MTSMKSTCDTSCTAQDQRESARQWLISELAKRRRMRYCKGRQVVMLDSAAVPVMRKKPCQNPVGSTGGEAVCGDV